MSEESHKEFKLLKKREMFCRFYAQNGHNAMEAAISAGYTPQMARHRSFEFLRVPAIINFINELEKPVLDKLGVSEDWVITKLKMLAEANVLDYYDIDPKTKKIHLKDLKNLPREKTAAIEWIKETRYGIEIKLVDKKACIINIGKYLGMFKEQFEGNINTNLMDTDGKELHYDSAEHADDKKTEFAGN
jgi:phage terminase small subunit